jgi:histidyl-tRNA synthetase
VNHRKLADDFFTGELGLSAEAALSVTKLIDARTKLGEEKFLGELERVLGPHGSSTGAIEKIQTFLNLKWEGLKQFGSIGSQHLQALYQELGSRGLAEHIELNTSILRGLDYYTGMVFELYDVSPENRRAMFGGGRYDNLVGIFGVKPALSGVGFGMGDVTLENFLETHGLKPPLSRGLDAFVSIPSQAFRAEASRLAAELRKAGLTVATALEVSGFGAQLKQASKLGAARAILFGDAEWAKGEVLVKELGTGEQRSLLVRELVSSLRASLTAPKAQ